MRVEELIEALSSLRDKVIKNKEVYSFPKGDTPIDIPGLFQGKETASEQLETIRDHIEDLMAYCGSGLTDFLERNFEDAALRQNELYVNPQDSVLDYGTSTNPVVLIDKPGITLQLLSSPYLDKSKVFGCRDSLVVLTRGEHQLYGMTEAKCSGYALVKAGDFSRVVFEENAGGDLKDYSQGHLLGKNKVGVTSHALAVSHSSESEVYLKGGTLISKTGPGVIKMNIGRGLFVDKSTPEPTYILPGFQDRFVVDPAENPARILSDKEKKLIETRFILADPASLILPQHYKVEEGEITPEELLKAIPSLFTLYNYPDLKQINEARGNRDAQLDIFLHNSDISEAVGKKEVADWLRNRFTNAELKKHGVYLFDEPAAIEHSAGKIVVGAHNRVNQMPGCEAVYWEKASVVGSFSKVHLRGETVGFLQGSMGYTSDESFLSCKNSQFSVDDNSLVSTYGVSRSSLGDQAIGLAHEDSVMQCCRNATVIQYDRAKIIGSDGTVYAPKESLVSWDKSRIVSDPEKLEAVRKAGEVVSLERSREHSMSR